MKNVDCSPFDPRYNRMPDNHLYFVNSPIAPWSFPILTSFEDGIRHLEDDCNGIGVIHKIKTEIVYFRKKED